MKKRIDIEKLLKWAYCDELPKGGNSSSGRAGSAWASIESFMQLLTKIDDNEYGVVPTLSPLDGDPHDDALRVHEAVCDLDMLHIDFPLDWNPIPEIADFPECDHVLSAARFGIGCRRKTAAELVRKHAILGGCPDWEGDVPTREVVRNGNGAPIWYQMRITHSLDESGKAVEFRSETEDGWNRNTKAPKVGAYQKFILKPDPTGLIISRGEYQIWRSCLDILTEELAEKLTSWELTPSPRTACPWEGEGWHGPRILNDLRFYS